MLLSDSEIIKRLKIRPTDRVLDIGGSMKQHGEIKIDTLVDLIRPEDAPYGASELRAQNFIKADITKEKLPFKDKEFDVVLCTHVLEDLPSPFLIISEMSRVAKRGLIVTPSMGYDMKFGDIDFTDWLIGATRVPGQAHHKWFFIMEKDILKIIPKNFPILYSPHLQITGWSGEPEMIFDWKGKINYKEFVSLNIHKLIDFYEKFIRENKNKIKWGRALFFVDNPINFAKAILKLVFHRGSGYVYRKKL